MNNLSAFYARTSTEEQRERQTIDSQVAALEKAIRDDHGLLFKRYIDDGHSGAVLARPGLDELLDDAKQRLFNKLYIYSPDRLSRELYLQLLIVKDLKRWGVEIVFLSHKFGDDPASQLLFQMLGAISQFERAQILERTSRGRLHKARRNLVVGAQAPYGYYYVKKTESAPGRYEIDDHEAENVRTMVRIFLSPRVGGIRTLAKELLKVGMKNRSGHSRWARSSVARILTNETYAGTTHYNKHYSCDPLKDAGGSRKLHTSRRLRAKEEWIPITVPAVISVADFMAVQEKLARNSEFSKRNAKYPYLLKSLVFCSCGKRRYGDPCHGKPRYKCSDKSHNYPLPKVCQEGSVDASVLDKAIWDAFFAALDRPEILASKVRSLEGEEKRIAQVREVEEKRVGRELASLDSQEQRLLKAYAEQAITVSQLKRLNNEINGKREKILNQSSKSSQTPSKKEGFEVSHGAVLKIFAAMREKALRAGDELKQRILQLFVDQVIVGGGTAVIRAYLPAISENDSIESITSACCARLPLRS